MSAETLAFGWFPPADQRSDLVPGNSIERHYVFAFGNALIECESKTPLHCDVNEASSLRRTFRLPQPLHHHGIAVVKETARPGVERYDRRHLLRTEFNVEHV